MSSDIEKVPEHLSGLTPKQQQFVSAYVANGGNGTGAAVEAGYSKTGARTEAHRLLRQPAVLKAIFSESQIQLATMLPKALAAQESLLTSSRSDMVKHLVAQSIVDRAFGKAPERVDHRVAADLTVHIDLT